MTAGRRPKLATFRFSGCGGCLLSLPAAGPDLLALAGELDLASVPELSRAPLKGPFDVVVVEGSITTPHDAERIHQVRRIARHLVALGACATSGGIQAARNSDPPARLPDPSTLQKSTPIVDHVFVDLELRGCPVDPALLVEALSALLHGRRPAVPASSVCLECRRAAVTCVLVAEGEPCLGPVTQAGCGALCPAFRRGCFGCNGPSESPNTRALARVLGDRLGATPAGLVRAFRSVAAGAEPFRREAEAQEADG